MSKQIRRNHNRVTAFIPVTVKIDSGQSIRGEIEDISLGGASIRCPHGLEPGQTVKLELHFAGLKSVFGEIIEVDEIDDMGLIRADEVAEVRWQKNGTQLGVKFVSLSSETKRFLKRLVKFFERTQVDDDAA
jgi:c-di-GMP-binding flagellar brake protein YcgR